MNNFALEAFHKHILAVRTQSITRAGVAIRDLGWQPSSIYPNPSKHSQRTINNSGFIQFCHYKISRSKCDINSFCKKKKPGNHFLFKKKLTGQFVTEGSINVEIICDKIKRVMKIVNQAAEK